jgi:hypothetical protein
MLNAMRPDTGVKGATESGGSSNASLPIAGCRMRRQENGPILIRSVSICQKSSTFRLWPRLSVREGEAQQQLVVDWILVPEKGRIFKRDFVPWELRIGFQIEVNGSPKYENEEKRKRGTDPP